MSICYWRFVGLGDNEICAWLGGQIEGFLKTFVVKIVKLTKFLLHLRFFFVFFLCHGGYLTPHPTLPPDYLLNVNLVAMGTT